MCAPLRSGLVSLLYNVCRWRRYVYIMYIEYIMYIDGLGLGSLETRLECAPPCVVRYVQIMCTDGVGLVSLRHRYTLYIHIQLDR